MVQKYLTLSLSYFLQMLQFSHDFFTMCGTLLYLFTMKSTFYFLSLFLVINNMFDPSPSLLDHGYHRNFKIVHNSLQHILWNSPYFSPNVFLQSLECVRAVLVHSPSSNPTGSSLGNMEPTGCPSSVKLAGTWESIASGKKGKFLYSAVSSPQDRSKRFYTLLP